MDRVIDRLTRSGAVLPTGLIEAVTTAERLGLPMEARLQLPADRFHLHAERARFDRPGVILVLADPALTRCALRWQRRAVRSTRTLEFVFPGQHGAAVAALGRLAGSRGLPDSFGTCDDALVARATAFVTASACADISQLPVWLRASKAPDRVRGVWLTLGRLRVLVPWEPDGGSAAATLAVLEEIGLHALDRSRELLNDLRLSTSTRRPEYLRDLRAIVQPAEMSPGRDPAVYIRRQLLQRNLHLTLAPGSLESATAWVAQAANRAPVLPALDANLHLDDPARLLASRGDTAVDDVVLLSAWRAAREARLIDQPGSNFELAAARIEARRSSLGWPWFGFGRADARLEWGAPHAERFDLMPETGGR